MFQNFSHLFAAPILLLAAPVAASQLEPEPRCTPPSANRHHEISLAKAVGRAVACNPTLASAGKRIEAAASRALQAAAFPNPELEMELENFGGRGDLTGFDGADSTIALAQSLELGGVRARRREVADAAVHVAASDLDLLRRDVILQATSTFFELLAAQQTLVLAEQTLGLAEEFAATVEMRVDAGKVSPVENTRARIETARAELERSDAVRSVSRARIRLAATWGAFEPDFDHAVGDLPGPQTIPSLSDLERRLERAPEAEAMRRNLDLHEKSIDLEKAVGIPDLRVSLGARHFRDSGRSAWVAGLSLPIPIFDRNRGARRAAEFELEAARHTAVALDADRRALLRRLVERLLATEEGMSSMSRIVEPAAAEAFAAVTIGYREGKFDFIDLLQAQRTLFAARSLALERRLEYALALCDLERLVGPISQPSTEVLS